MQTLGFVIIEDRVRHRISIRAPPGKHSMEYTVVLEHKIFDFLLG